MLVSTFFNPSCILLGLHLVTGVTASPTKGDSTAADGNTIDALTLLTPRAVVSLTPGQQNALDIHNAARAQLFEASPPVAPLIWDEELASSARKWVETVAQTGAFKHSGYKGVGENMFIGAYNMKGENYGVTGDRIFPAGAQSWLIGKTDFSARLTPKTILTQKLYDYSTQIHQYTQMVWRNTTRVGMAVAKRVNGAHVDWYLVAHYSPPGNWLNERIY